MPAEPAPKSPHARVLREDADGIRKAGDGSTLAKPEHEPERGGEAQLRSTLVAAVIAAGLVGTRAARAEDACAADVKQFCGGVQVGGGGVQECLRQNETKLSAACRTKMAAAEAKFRGIVEEFARTCRRDIDRLCSEVQPGRGRIVACLIRQQDDLSSSCRPEVERIQGAGDAISTIRAACRADAERLCGGVPPEAGPLVECLQANRSNLSETCRSLGPEGALVPAEFVDALASARAEERSQELLQILQGIESIAFARSGVLFQFDSYQGLGGMANADRLIFNPQVVFGSQREFQIQLKAPVIAVYPYAPDRPAQTGLGAINTAFAWAFYGSARVHQYLSLGLQWISPVQPPVGSAWAMTPGYAISIGLARALSVTGQVGWIRSFASRGYPELDLLVVEPIVVLNLPGRTFLSLDTKLGWNFVDSSLVPVIKGIVGLYLDRRKSLSISAWYQTVLSTGAEASDDPGTLAFKFAVGTALGYFFDW